MRFTVRSLILPLVVSVTAISVTEPTKGEEVDPSNHFTVKWSTVSTDPSTVDIYLVNNAVYPSIEKKVATDIKTSEGSYTVKDVSDISAGPGYQINLVSTSGQNTGILAQSSQFHVADSSSSSTTSSTTSSSKSSTTATSPATKPTKHSAANETVTNSTASSTTTAPAPSANATHGKESSDGSSVPIPSPNAAAGALVSPLITAAVLSFAAFWTFA